MARVSKDFVDTVRNTVDIADVIGQYVQLRPAGKSLMALCPFHDERTPSFSVDEKKQFFYCFSCHRGGDVFTFLEDLKNESFAEALAEVANFAHLSMPADWQAQTEKKTNSGASSRYHQLVSLQQQAMELYHHVLMHTAAGEPGRRYLKRRGMTREMIDQFHIGFAPEQRILKQYFTEKKVDYQLLRQSGLFTTGRGDAEELTDRFINRLMFPILNGNGQVIAFSGRLLTTRGTDLPKYLNSPDTPIFDKSQLLFNYDQAKTAARKAGKLILFEGFMDVISAFSAGVKNGVASMGTSFTGEQVQLIVSTTAQLDICYDGDDPGQNAINRALKLINQEARRPLTLRVVQLPAGIDPDEYVQKYGGAQFRQFLNHHEESPVSFQLRYLRRGLDLTNQAERLSYLNAALAVVATEKDPLGRDMYVQQLAQEFKLDSQALAAQLQTILHRRGGSEHQTVHRHFARQNGRATPQIDIAVADQPSQTEQAEQMLFYSLLADDGSYERLRANAAQFSFPDRSYDQLYHIFQQVQATAPDRLVRPDDLMAKLPDANLKALLASIQARSNKQVLSERAFDDLVRFLTQKVPLDAQIEKTKAALQEASAVHNDDLETTLTAKLVQLYAQQQQLKTEES